MWIRSLPKQQITLRNTQKKKFTVKTSKIKKPVTFADSPAELKSPKATDPVQFVCDDVLNTPYRQKVSHKKIENRIQTPGVSLKNYKSPKNNEMSLSPQPPFLFFETTQINTPARKLVSHQKIEQRAQTPGRILKDFDDEQWQNEPTLTSPIAVNV